MTTGVVIVGANARILHANQAARELMAGSGPIGDRHGRLICRNDGVQSGELRAAIDAATGCEAALGGRGIGVALQGTKGPTVATVLPLGHGNVRTRLVPSATAAVFLNTRHMLGRAAVDAIGRAHGLTPAESRVLLRLADGDTMTEAAAALGIAELTTKTHLKQIFLKTGVARQADLVALVARLAPPIREAG